MSDNGIWFKLWIGADEDPDLGDLSLEDFARWCKFGLYLKKYGNNGVIELKDPCLALQHKFRVTSFDGVLNCIRKFPNCDISLVTNAIVTWKNWHKYQEDSSAERTRKYRERVTTKKRREEMRRDEMRRDEKEPPKSPKGGNAKDYSFDFLRAWKLNGYGSKDKAWQSWKKLGAHLDLEIQEKILNGLQREVEWRRLAAEYKNTVDPDFFIPAWKNFVTWLNQKCWTQGFREIPKPTTGFNIQSSSNDRIRRALRQGLPE